MFERKREEEGEGRGRERGREGGREREREGEGEGERERERGRERERERERASERVREQASFKGHKSSEGSSFTKIQDQDPKENTIQGACMLRKACKYVHNLHTTQ